LDSIIARFEQGDIPASIAMATFPAKDTPMLKWSYINRVLCFLNGTDDARGYRQWEQVGRYVKKGCKAFPILAPKFKKVKEDNEEAEESVILSGFLAVPVFKVEDTEGDPLPYQSIPLPKLPLSEVAKEFGLDIKAIPSDYEYFGYYCHDRKEIAIATEHESVFFHELAHAADYRIRDLKPSGGQKLDREIIAELSACTLAYIVGKKLPETLGNHFQYIKHYASKADMSVLTACMKYLGSVESVLKEILSHCPEIVYS
jgi:hypothetical protein